MKITTNVNLPKYIESELQNITEDATVLFDFSDEVAKVIVKCRIGRNIYVSSKTFEISYLTLSELLDKIIDCIADISVGVPDTTSLKKEEREVIKEIDSHYMEVNLAEAIRIDRYRRQLTLEEYGRNVGVPSSTLQHYEKGTTQPRDLAVRKRIIDYIECRL